MGAAFGEWVSTHTPTQTTWIPQIDPALVEDERFPALFEAASNGIDFSETVVLITGASDPHSIGYAIGRNFARGGAKVIITGSRDLDRISTTAQQLADEAGAGSVLPAQVNQGSFEELDALFAHLKEQGITCTHVYPFAAINHPAVFFGIKPEDYQRVFQINVFGVYHLCVKYCRNAPRKQPWYVVVPLSPNDGRLQGSGLYPATKQALIPLVVQGQNEYGNRKGGCYTGLSIAWTRSSLMSKLDGGVELARDIGLTVYETEDTADCATLLGTEAASALKGDVLNATGGFDTVEPERMSELFK